MYKGGVVLRAMSTYCNTLLRQKAFLIPFKYPFMFFLNINLESSPASSALNQNQCLALVFCNFSPTKDSF